MDDNFYMFEMFFILLSIGVYPGSNLTRYKPGGRTWLGEGAEVVCMYISIREGENALKADTVWLPALPETLSKNWYFVPLLLTSFYNSSNKYYVNNCRKGLPSAFEFVWDSRLQIIFPLNLEGDAPVF